MVDINVPTSQYLLTTPFATALYQLRDARGWSQQEVADLLGVSANTVSRWERGEIARPDPVNRRRLAELFGVTVGELGLTRPHPSRQTAEPPTPGALQGTPGLPSLVAVACRLDIDAGAQRAWRASRRALNAHRFQLSTIARQLYRSPTIGPRLLTSPSWLPPSPIRLDRISIEWVGHPAPAQVTGTESAASRVLPQWFAGLRYQRYTQVLRDLDPPKLLENRPSYRLLDINLGGGATLTVGPTTYFELTDLAEALAHELAVTHLVTGQTGPVVFRPPSWRSLTLRRLVGEPFDLSRRPVPCSVNTLTVRRDKRGGPSIILHQRDPSRVAVCGGMYHVMPAGVFQPCSIASATHAADEDLWHNVLREYAEEFLGDLSCDGNAANPLDYNEREPFRTLQRARQDGMLEAWFLGAGLDPLTLWGELLTAVVIDAEVFDEVFHELVPANQEGSVVQLAHRKVHGIPLGHERLEQLRHVSMAPAATACLELAWQHRRLLFEE